MSKPKRKGGPLRIPTPEEEGVKFSKRDLVGLLPLINIALSVIFILLIPNFFIDLVLFFMLILTIGFFLSMIIELWQTFQTTPIENNLLIYNSINVSPLVLYAGQFFYGYFFLTFLFLGYIEALSVLSIIIWVYFGFSVLFIVIVIWAITVYVKESGEKKEELKNKIMEDLNKHKKTDNYAAQNHYLQLLIEIRKTPLIKAGFLSKLITVITIFLTIVPFIIPA